MIEVPLVSYLDGNRRVVGVAHVNEKTGFVEGIVKDSEFARRIQPDSVGEISITGNVAAYLPRQSLKCTPCEVDAHADCEHEVILPCTCGETHDLLTTPDTLVPLESGIEVQSPEVQLD